METSIFRQAAGRVIGRALGLALSFALSSALMLGTSSSLAAHTTSGSRVTAGPSATALEAGALQDKKEAKGGGGMLSLHDGRFFIDLHLERIKDAVRIKFKNGTRGSGSGDQSGKLMQLSAQALPDEQAMKDVAAYILTLENN